MISSKSPAFDCCSFCFLLTQSLMQVSGVGLPPHSAVLLFAGQPKGRYFLSGARNCVEEVTMQVSP